jgi:FixJ family two-component response regulator
VLREKANRTGVADVLEKPILDNALLDSIRQIVGRAASTGAAPATT